MKSEKLKKFILQYMENDKTNRALMLTGDWGSGKSYFIKNTLLPYLREDGRNHECVMVSLYGLSSLSDVSKAVYLETKMKWRPATETQQKIKIFAKTIIKNATGKLGIDLQASEEDLQSLYESIDLSGKLIIFEDVERTQVDLIEFLGYVNSLVEQDEVKVLLVTNEKEILKSTIHETEDQKQGKRRETIYTDEAKKYLAVKEKTVGDTVTFEGDYCSALKAIFGKFTNKQFKKLRTASVREYVLDLMITANNYNLRSIIYACQKTTEIFAWISKNLKKNDFSQDFYQTIFFGIINYSLRTMSGEKPSWDSNGTVSYKLGNRRYPLFRFCYEYIITQSLAIEDIVSAADDLDIIRRYDPKKTVEDHYVKILTSYATQKEEDVKNAINIVCKKLQQADVRQTDVEQKDGPIPFHEYGKIAYAAIAIEEYFNIQTTSIQEALVNNLRGRGDNLRDDTLFLLQTNDVYKDSAVGDKYTILSQKMINTLRTSRQIYEGFSYDPDQSPKLLEYVHDKSFKAKSFIELVDAKKLAKMFTSSTASQMQDIRDAVFSAFFSYRDLERENLAIQNIEEYFAGVTFLNKYRSQIRNLANNHSYDAIHRWHISSHLSDLNAIIESALVFLRRFKGEAEIEAMLQRPIDS